MINTKKDRIIFILTIPFVFLIIVLLIVLRPFVQVRFYELRTERIGHFTIQTELYLTRKKFLRNKKKILDIFCTKSKISNDFFKKKINNLIVIFPRVLVFPVIFALKKLEFNYHLVPTREFFQKDLDNLLDKSSSSVIFTNEENLLGRNTLIQMGIKENDKYVCINTRDNLYAKKNLNMNLDYHQYRNVNIEKLEKVFEFLESQNIKVVRMGKDVEKPLPFKSSNFIDYAFSNFRSDFMDFFLIKNCYFYLGTGGGLDGVPMVLRKPKLTTNLAPIIGITSEIKNVMTIFKHHYSKKLKRRLSLKEIVDLNYFNIFKDDIFKKEQIILEENSCPEIIEAIKDLINLIEKKLELSEQDKKYQKKFWKYFPLNYANKDGFLLHGKKINSLISPSFLAKNYYLIHN